MLYGLVALQPETGTDQYNDLWAGARLGSAWCDKVGAIIIYMAMWLCFLSRKKYSIEGNGDDFFIGKTDVGILIFSANYVFVEYR